MGVEDVPGVGLASRGTAQQQRHLAVGDRVLGEIVVDDKRILPAVGEVLRHGAPGVRGEVLHRRGRVRVGDNNDRVVHRSVPFEGIYHPGDRRRLLAYGDVDTDDLLPLLVDDRVESNRCLPGAAVANDQLALPASDWCQRVDRLEARLERGIDRLPLDHARGLDLRLPMFGRGDLPLAVHRTPERIDDTSEKRLTDRGLQNTPGTANLVPFLYVLALPEQGHPDALLLQVEDEAVDIVRELHDLRGHRLLQPEDAGDSIPYLDDHPNLSHVEVVVKPLDLLLEYGADLVLTW